MLSRRAHLSIPELAALAGSGAAAFFVRVDAADVVAMAKVLAWARERLPAVSTFAHAAGALAQVRLLLGDRSTQSAAEVQPVQLCVLKQVPELS